MKDYIFLIQIDSVDIVDTAIVKYVLDSNRSLYEYEELTIKDLEKSIFNKDKTYIPVGNIDFIRKTMQKLYNPNFIEQPIEIPTYLQTPEFLKRTYKVVKWNEIPQKINGF